MKYIGMHGGLRCYTDPNVPPGMGGYYLSAAALPPVRVLIRVARR